VKAPPPSPPRAQAVQDLALDIVERGLL